MKKCTYCGDEYPDEATTCPTDGQPLTPLTPQPLAAAPPAPQRPASVPPAHPKPTGLTKRISHISVHQTSKVFAILYVAIGLLFIPIGVVMILAGQMVMGIIYVLMPFIYGIIGYPLAALMCWIYNLIAKGVGGVEFTVEDESNSD